MEATVALLKSKGDDATFQDKIILWFFWDEFNFKLRARGKRELEDLDNVEQNYYYRRYLLGHLTTHGFTPKKVETWRESHAFAG